jgi:hypothetical protein
MVIMGSLRNTPRKQYSKQALPCPALFAQRQKGDRFSVGYPAGNELLIVHSMVESILIPVLSGPLVLAVEAIRNLLYGIGRQENGLTKVT